MGDKKPMAPPPMGVMPGRRPGAGAPAPGPSQDARGGPVAFPTVRPPPPPPADMSKVPWAPPVKAITTAADVSAFAESDAYQIILNFVLRLNEAVQGKSNKGECRESKVTKAVMSVLDRVQSWVDEIEPMTQQMRFGNKAFRTLYARLRDQGEQLVLSVLPSSLAGAAVELSVYFREAFGNDTRIDYGSGHELNFIAFLACLERLGLFGEADHQALVTRVYLRYLSVVRSVQKKYMMEPAGSRGVWGLDDYQFLVFLWGSSQLIGHKMIRPKSIHNQDTREGFRRDFMYLDAICFIHEVKTGPFGEHSPTLDSISEVPRWEKVNTGMIKMYHAEVLLKQPVIQHFFFGNLIPYTPPTSSS